MHLTADNVSRHSADNFGNGPARSFSHSVKLAAAALGAALLSACAAAPVAPPPPPPPPVVVETVPIRPLPPAGASYFMDIPPRDGNGGRITVNSNLSDDQLVWNLRSAWNVAALNCLGSHHDPILQGYSAFLRNNVRSLKAVNDRIEKTYSDRFRVRRDYMVARDGDTTRVYNFFALPMARTGFCMTALEVAERYLADPKVQPLPFAQANFAALLAPFHRFYDDYEAYQVASAEWDAKWGDRYGASQPGWVAVQEARANGVVIPAVSAFGAGQPGVQSVIDPETGVAVPVIPVQEGFVSQPVVEPIAIDPPQPE
jgi:hypothetical protein